MVRKYQTLLTCFGLALAAPLTAGCSFQASAGTGQPAESPPPPPPPPPVPATQPPASDAPAATTGTAGADATTTPTPAETAAGPSKVTVKNDRLTLPGNIVFEFGKSALKADAGNDAVLQQLKLYLDENPNVTQLRVEGHTDNVGEPQDNLELSGQRALTVKKWLVAQGIPAERVLATGFGETKPIADNSTEEGRAQNRRTEFFIATFKGRRYLGKDPKGGGQVFE